MSKLVIVQGDRSGSEFPLSSNARFTIGSAEACAVQVADAGVGQEHAVVERVNDGWTVRALDPRKPIEIDGRNLSTLRLDHGTVFQVGATRLRFVSSRATIDSTPLAGKQIKNQDEAVAKLGRAYARIKEETAKVIIGQKSVLEQVLVALFAQGHCLIVGAPGLAKTLMVRTLAGTLDLESKRIQFTPDLMPADITGTDILEEDPENGARRFRFRQGPLFTNMVLADEINRTPPKTQAALLEAMAEKRITISGVTYDLPRPFLVLATQNPIEQEGTYPLPEAQLDRFMFCIHVDYPAADEEQRILLETTRDIRFEVDRVLSADTILQFQHLVRQVPVSEHVATYAASLIRATRPADKTSPDWIKRWVRWGAGTRAGQYLLLAAKSHSLLEGRSSVSCADVRTHALPVLRHRIFCTFAAASEGVTTDDIVKRLLDSVQEPNY